MKFIEIKFFPVVMFCLNLRIYILIKAVQSSAGTGTSYETWFDALEYREKEIDKISDFDIALIGCGAYGMHLAAYCKRKGKIGLHLASYVQLLFGIYGKRWIEDDRISPLLTKVGFDLTKMNGRKIF